MVAKGGAKLINNSSIFYLKKLLLPLSGFGKFLLHRSQLLSPLVFAYRMVTILILFAVGVGFALDGEAA